MAAKAFDLVRYKKLIAATPPRVPQTQKDNEDLLAAAESLGRKAQLSPEEEMLLDVLVLMIENFEERHYRIKQSAPHEVLRELMRARGLQPKDLWPVFGSRGITSETLKGKRSISKEKAKALAAMFHIPVKILI